MLPPETEHVWDFLNFLSNPPTLAEMKAFFVAQRDQLEIELAAEAKRRQHQAGGDVSSDGR